jgi:hypothetical protein
MHPHHNPGRRNASAVRGGRTIDHGPGDWPAEGIPGQELGEVPAEGRSRGTGEDGIATAEFAIVTLAAVGFAGLLVTILTSGDVRELLLGLVRQALSY